MTAKVQPSKEQWEVLKRQLTFPTSSVKLRIDGYDVSVRVERVRMRLVLTVYVNGWIKGEWITADCEERRRFYRPKKIFIHKPAARRRMNSRSNKKMYKELGIDPDKSFTSYFPWWTSFDAMRRHFVKHNDVIEVIE